MKATILSDGTLSVSPESELEAYALGRWSQQNIGDWFNAAARPMAIIIDFSAYPRTLEPLTVPNARPGHRV
ncbi:hypothetical protein [Burkholderia cenocepacia]|uniref:hypothetical protein n=1 Tax=Burkholderia cenocepacia TaxID=95486 RepID=UPI0026551CEE|nr:hypothetical protein [Burkholderia cenocepacia]MDN7544803.1 hypothetical protein [Burkholderia cenocepacia]MDN7626980.1 hypothetical protein [Burkholderia cenocepacia]